MRLKISGLFFIGILIIIFSSSFAASGSCKVDLRNNCINENLNIVMGLSYTSDAHGQIGSGFTGSCSGTATSCSSFGILDCANQQGCSLVFDDAGNKVCTGIPTSCDSFTDTNSCNAQDGCSWSGDIIYQYALCCDLGSSTVCTPTGNPNNVVLSLSDNTNAHAEEPYPASPAYTTNQVCYVSIDCEYVSAGGSCSTGKNEILSLSGSTNAHVGIPGSYGSKICCNVDYGSTSQCGNGVVDPPEECDSTVGCVPPGKTNECACDTSQNFVYDAVTQECKCAEGYEYFAETQTCEAVIGGGEPYAYWTDQDMGDFELSSKDVIVGQTTVYLIFRNSGYSEGTQVSFSIYEKDFFADDFIRTVVGTADANEHISVNWTVSQDDIDATGEEEPDAFYFNVNHNDGDQYTSEDLTFTIVQAPVCEAITACMDYFTQQACENDVNLCTVASYSVENNNPNIDCEDPSITCSCDWNETLNQCGPKWGVDGGGTCIYTENTDDTCDDKFLTYSWEATWEGPDHELKAECKSGQNVIPCPAKVQLPFFNFYNILGVIVLIILIYLVLNSKKKKPRKKHKKKKK